MDVALPKFGKKSGKLLVRLCRGPHNSTFITSLRDSNGITKSIPQEVNRVMLQYCTSLYAHEPINKHLAQSFLGKLRLPTISSSQLNHLNLPISESELSNTIKHLAPNKGPGPDVFTSEFFKTLQNIVTPSLLEVYNGICAGGPYLPTSKQAIIKLLANKGKDPLEPGSYRPISLLNLDVKILSNIIATRLTDILPSVIHPAQSGFVKGRTASLNICKVLMVLEHAKANPGKNFAIITLDAEKAFDNVSFEWLLLVLSSLDFSGPFSHVIETMYASPSARLVVAGLLSEDFLLFKGTRQECLLSPLLFHLTIEPFPGSYLNWPHYKGYILTIWNITTHSL